MVLLPVQTQLRIGNHRVHNNVSDVLRVTFSLRRPTELVDGRRIAVCFLRVILRGFGAGHFRNMRRQNGITHRGT